MEKKKKSKILPIVALAAGAALMFSSFKKKDEDIDANADIPQMPDFEPDDDIYVDDEEYVPAEPVSVQDGTITSFHSPAGSTMFGNTIYTTKFFSHRDTYTEYRIRAVFDITPELASIPVNVTLTVYVNDDPTGYQSAYKVGAKVLSMTAPVVSGAATFKFVSDKLNTLADGSRNGSPYVLLAFSLSLPDYGAFYNAVNETRGHFDLKRVDVDLITDYELKARLEKQKTQRADDYKKTSPEYYGDPAAPYDKFYDYSDADRDVKLATDAGYRSSMAFRLRIPEGALMVGHISDWQPYAAWGDLPDRDNFLTWMRFWSDRGNICPGAFGSGNGYQMTYMPQFNGRHIYRFYFPLEIFNPIDTPVQVKELSIVEMKYCGHSMLPYSDKAMLELGGVVQAYSEGKGKKAWFNPYKGDYSPDSDGDYKYPDLWSAGVKDKAYNPDQATFYNRMPVTKIGDGRSGWHTNGSSENEAREAGDQLAKLFFGNDDRCSYHTAGSIWLDENTRVKNGFNNAKFLAEYKKLAKAYTLSEMNPVSIWNCLHFTQKDGFHSDTFTIPANGSLFVPVSLGDICEYLHEDWNGLFAGGWGVKQSGTMDAAAKVDIASSAEQSLMIKFAIKTSVDGGETYTYHTVFISHNPVANVNSELSFVHQPWSADSLKCLSPSYACTQWKYAYQDLKAMHDGGYRFIKEQCRQHGVPVFGDDLK